MRVGVGVLGNQSMVGLGDSNWVGSGSGVGTVCDVCPAQAAINKRTEIRSQLYLGI
jgi:hypothetical protein